MRNYSEIQAQIRRANRLRSEALGELIVKGWARVRAGFLSALASVSAQRSPAQRQAHSA